MIVVLRNKSHSRNTQIQGKLNKIVLTIRNSKEVGSGQFGCVLKGIQLIEEVAERKKGLSDIARDSVEQNEVQKENNEGMEQKKKKKRQFEQKRKKRKGLVMMLVRLMARKIKKRQLLVMMTVMMMKPFGKV